jgi:uncharacterized membrane protein
MADSTPPPTIVSMEEHEQMLVSFLEFEKNFYRNYFPLWLGTLIGPWILTFILIGVLYVIHLDDLAYWWKLVNAAFWSFVLFGRFTIVASQSLGVPATHLFWMVTYQDVMVALFFTFHVGFMYRLPWVGPKIAELSVDSEFILAHQPWMKRLTFLGLLVFIAFPLAATGSVGGAIFGRLLGLSRWAIFWGSSIGAIIGNAAMLFLNKSVERMFPGLQDNPVMKWGGLPIILLIILLLERRYRTMKNAFVAQQQQSVPVNDPPNEPPAPADQ